MIRREWSSGYPGAGVLVAVLLATAGPAMADRGTGEPRAIRRERPLTFEANRGQADAQVKFLARGPGYTAFLTSTGAVLTLDDGRPGRTVVRVTPVGADPAARIVGDGELPGVVRYFRGASAIPPVSASTYAGVRYVDVYPGIDLVYHGRSRRLEYDFVVAPGADPGAIALAFDGVDRVAVDGDGTLVAHTAAGDLRQPRPVVYQEIDGARHGVDGDFVVDAAGRVHFRLGTYDRSRALVIDPLLAYSTYLGGTGDDSEVSYEGGASIAVDAAGNLYVAGTTRSADFPTTPGAVEAPSGGLDIFVTKLSPAGDLVYSTYLGSSCDDVARAIAVDAAGNAYFTGRVFGGANCDLNVPPGVLVAKLDPDGALLYGSKLGGSVGDSSVGQAIAVDAEGNAYVTGVAVSESDDFPTTPGAFGTAECANDYPLAGDVFVAKVSADGHELLYSTILCGKRDDSPSGIAVDATGIAYVAGTTLSRDFPTVHPLQASPHGGPDTETGFVAAVAPDGSHLVYSTYLGGSDSDSIQGIAVDGQGNAYVTGETASQDFPTTTGVLQQHAGNRDCPEVCTDAFVTKIDPTGSALLYSTYLYGELSDRADGIAVDGAGNAYLVGTTNSQYFPIVDAFQTEIRSATDAFVAKLNPDGTRLVYSSYLGGSHMEGRPRTGWDTASAVALDAGGNAYVAGYTQSYDFPTTPDAFQPSLADGTCDVVLGIPCGDAFVAKVGAGGPGIVPPITVAVTSAEVAAGGTLTATWAGIKTPRPKDSLQLYALGAPFGDLQNIAAWRYTGATSDGTLSLDLPADLPLGWYELRLVNFTDGPIVVARIPIRVSTGATPSTTVATPTTTTGPQSITLCDVVGRAACDDGDPCTIDTCVPGQGCASMAAAGLESVTCTCRRDDPPACAGQAIPTSIGRRQGRACGLFSDAGGPSAMKRLRRGMVTLNGSIAVVAKAHRKGKLSHDCAGALKSEMVDAKDRAARLLATRAMRGR